MKVLEAEFAKSFIRLCSEGYRRGWHERNGGNLSYRMTEEEAESVKENFVEGEWISAKCHVPSLANEYFLVKATGGYMMNMERDPEHNMGIIQLDEKGENYRILWGFSGGMHPTSELPSHLMNLEVVKNRSNGALRVVYHCHPAEVIALTFVLPLDSKTFTKYLWGTMTECPIVFPAGVGVLPWMVPGGEEIAKRTSDLMKTYDVAIWSYHGAFVTGTDFDAAFGLIDCVVKSADIVLKVLASGGFRRQMSDSDFIQLEEPYNFRLNDDFVDRQ